MDTLYDRLLQMNTVPGAYEGWEAYRKTLTSFITAHAPKGGTLLIVGAGECNDMDLKTLLTHFEKLVLLDIDTAAMERGLKKQGVEEGDAVQTLRADFLGVPEEGYRALAQAMLISAREGKDGETLGELFLTLTDNLISFRKPDSLPEADTVVAAGVHSQLLAMFARLAALFSQQTALDLPTMFKALNEYNNRLQPRLNDRLYRAARKCLLLGFEESRTGVPGGIEGAAQAFFDAFARFPVTVAEDTDWPFDHSQGKGYHMKLLAIPKQ